MKTIIEAIVNAEVVVSLPELRQRLGNPEGFDAAVLAANVHLTNDCDVDFAPLGGVSEGSRYYTLAMKRS